MRAEGFFCNLDILYGGLGIGKLQFLIKNFFFFSAVIFFQFLVIKALDPDWIRIRIGVHPEMLDPDPDEMNADPQPWSLETIFWFKILKFFEADPGSGIHPGSATMFHYQAKNLRKTLISTVL